MNELKNSAENSREVSQISLRGRWIGPALACFLAVILKTQSDIQGPALATACTVVLMAVWWITEAIPLAATAMLPLALFPILGVGEKMATAPQIGQAVVWNLDNPRFGERHQTPLESDSPREGSGTSSRFLIILESSNLRTDSFRFRYGTFERKNQQACLKSPRAAMPANLFS